MRRSKGFFCDGIHGESFLRRFDGRFFATVQEEEEEERMVVIVYSVVDSDGSSLVSCGR